MILSFNPVNVNHWIKKHFIDSGLATVIHTTYKDNKFLNEEDKKVLESFKNTDQYYYQVYCLGQWGVLGKTFFNAELVTNRIAELDKPIMVGQFLYEYDGKYIKNSRFVEDKDGCIKIYELPKTGYPFVLAR